VSGGDTPAPAPWEWLVEGYSGALDRFRATADERDRPEKRFIPLFEALNWVAAIMAFPGAPSLYDDSVVRALRFARNRVHHSFADALEPRDVPFAPGLVVSARGGSRIVAPPTVLDWFWKSPEELPAGREDAKGEKAYREHLAGEPVEHALAHLRSLL
jgi:hypothetical protein